MDTFGRPAVSARTAALTPITSTTPIRAIAQRVIPDLRPWGAPAAPSRWTTWAGAAVPGSADSYAGITGSTAGLAGERSDGPVGEMVVSGLVPDVIGSVIRRLPYRRPVSALKAARRPPPPLSCFMSF